MPFEKRNASEYVADPEKIRKTELYRLVKSTIENLLSQRGIENPSSVGTFLEIMRGEAEDDLLKFKVIKDGPFPMQFTICDRASGERITYNARAKHGDKCPKLRSIFDSVNGDSDFPHFAVVLDKMIYIDNEEATREYADRLISKSANLVIRIAEISKKCPLQEPIAEVENTEPKA